MDEAFSKDYKRAAEEFLSLMGGKPTLHPETLWERFKAAAGIDKIFDNNKMILFKPPPGCSLTGKAYDNRVGAVSWLYFLGIHQCVKSLEEGETVENIVASISASRNPIIAISGALPPPPPGLSNLISRSAEAEKDGYLAFHEDVLSLIRVGKRCRGGNERLDKEQNKFFDWLEKVVQKRIKGQSFARILPLELNIDPTDWDREIKDAPGPAPS